LLYLSSMLRRTAAVLALVCVQAGVAAAAAADSHTAGNPDSGGDALSILAFAILLVGLAWIAVPEKQATK